MRARLFSVKSELDTSEIGNFPRRNCKLGEQVCLFTMLVWIKGNFVKVVLKDVLEDGRVRCPANAH